MQMSKIISIYLAVVGCLCFINSSAQSGQVLRIKSSNCAYNTKGGTTNFATGFVYKENGRVVGVITALHAVCGCSSISAEDNSGTDYFSLKVSKADIENDIALLTSSEIISNFNTGLEFSDLSTSALANKKVSMYAYPYGVELNIDTKDARVRETPTALLKKFVKSDIETSLKERGSPNINKFVLNLQLEITPGCSGAPILYDNKVIGVANGGLDEGRTHVCWAIPTKNIQWSPVGSLEPAYTNLGKSNPNKLFVLTCDIEGDEKDLSLIANKNNSITKAIPLKQDEIDSLLFISVTKNAALDFYEDEINYSIGLLLDVSFISNEFRNSDFINSLSDIKFVTKNSEQLKFESTEKHFKNKKYYIISIKSSQLVFIPENIIISINDKDFDINIGQIQWASMANDTKKYQYTYLKAPIVFSNPDWIVFNGARLLKTMTPHKYLLELKLENLSNSKLMLDKISVEAYHNWGILCHHGTGLNPWQEVFINLTKVNADSIISGSSWTEINSIQIEAKSIFREASCSHYTHDLLIEIPTQDEVPAHEKIRLCYIINFNVNLNINIGRIPPSDLLEWDEIIVSLPPNISIYPNQMKVSK